MYIMNRINKLIDINERGLLTKFVECYKTVKDIVYNGDGKKAYESFKIVDKL